MRTVGERGKTQGDSSLDKTGGRGTALELLGEDGNRVVEKQTSDAVHFALTNHQQARTHYPP